MRKSKASPSKGIICPDFDPEAIARSYEQAGASCLSVLTDETYFQGSLDALRRVREVVQLPLLRKDFMIDPRQIEQAIAYGADAILLIVAMLEQETLRQLHDLATQAGLTALVEVHDEEELKRAIDLGAKLVGVNNRNLKDFTVNLSTTHQLAARWESWGKPKDALLVAESGLSSAQDVRQVHQGGAAAILVGESRCAIHLPSLSGSRNCWHNLCCVFCVFAVSYLPLAYEIGDYLFAWRAHARCRYSLACRAGLSHQLLRLPRY